MPAGYMTFFSQRYPGQRCERLQLQEEYFFCLYSDFAMEFSWLIAERNMFSKVPNVQGSDMPHMRHFASLNKEMQYKSATQGTML